MRIKSIFASCAFASFCLASSAASAASIHNSDFSFNNSGFGPQGAYAIGLWLQGAASNHEAVGSIAWTNTGAAPAGAISSYEMLTPPGSVQHSMSGRALPASSPLPGAGVVGLIAILALAARRDLLG